MTDYLLCCFYFNRENQQHHSGKFNIRNIDKSMIGLPTNFQHCAHIGCSDVLSTVSSTGGGGGGGDSSNDGDTGGGSESPTLSLKKLPNPGSDIESQMKSKGPVLAHQQQQQHKQPLDGKKGEGHQMSERNEVRDPAEEEQEKSMRIDDDEQYQTQARPNHVIKYNQYIDVDLSDFQNVNQFIKHLPYFDKLKQNAFDEYDLIKTNLSKSLLLNEIRPGLVHWTNRLQTYINEYGLFFTKHDHLRFIQIYLEIIHTNDVDLVIVDLCFSILIELLKKYELLSREDLKLDWKPLYKLYKRIHKIDECSSTLAPENIEQISFLNFISFARIYFDETATAEMLDEWRPLMCPFDMSINDAFERFNLFLPTIFTQKESKNLNLWLGEFLDMWFIFSGKALWESNLINLLSRVASDNAGSIDWSPYIAQIFTKALRGLGLTLACEHSISTTTDTPKEAPSYVTNLLETYTYTEVDIDSLGTWIVSMIASTGTDRNLCMKHIKQLMYMLRFYFHPSNTGSFETLFSFLQRLPEALIERIRFEKLKKYEWIRKGRNEESFITDRDVEEFVICMRDLVLLSIFSRTNFNDAIKTFQYLCFLRSDIMLPALMDKMNAHFAGQTSDDDMHRYTPMLACLVSVPREFVSSSVASIRVNLLQIIRSVLTAIDIADLNRFILTFQFLTNVFGNLIICDCSPAVHVRDDLSEDEKELCLMTSNFEDLIDELLFKIFAFIDHLAGDSSSESSAQSAVMASIYSRNNSAITGDNVTQVHVIQMLKALVCQSSKAILKLIVNRVYKFMNGNSYNFKAGDILASLVGFLVSSGYGKESFEKFFDYVYNNLTQFKENKNFNNFLRTDSGDSFIMWNLHLFSHLLKANGLILVNEIVKIKELFYWYRSSINKDCVSHLTSCYSNIINSLTKIYPKDVHSVQYSLMFDEPNEFFAKHLPIRDWGKYISVDDLNIEYHIPNVKEIDIALEIVGSTLNESINFLKKSIFFSHSERNAGNKILKEENYRELNLIYHIMYGASCLLKRPVNREFITDHIDSNVAIGMKENINKGLGFEYVNLVNQEHEYSKLSAENKDILVNMRQAVIEFTIKLAEKLIDEKSSDTNMLILITRILTTASSIFGIFASEFEKTWKSHFVNKSTIQNKLIFKKYPREELVRRVVLQYMYRCFHLHMSLIDLDFKIINILTNLCINSAYEIVRDEARVHLFELLGQFPYSAMTILPSIVKILNKSNSDKKSTKEQLEGCLLLLKGNNKQTSMLIKQNWFTLSKLWPALFKCKNFDKEAIQTLLDKIYFNANLNFNSFDNRVKFGARLVELAFELYAYAADHYSSEELRLKLYNQKCSYENHLISKLMDDLIDIAKDSNISWKNQEISLFSLIFLLNSCELHKKLLTFECVELFVSSLIHENPNIRRISIDALCIILKMVKPKKECKEYDSLDLVKEINPQLSQSDIIINKPRPGYRKDNNWYLYDPNYINTISVNELDSVTWEESKFLDKSFWGYYCWPKTLKVNTNKRNTFTYSDIKSSLLSSASVDSGLCDFAEAVKPIKEKFQYDADFVKKFIKLTVSSSNPSNTSTSNSGDATKTSEKFDKKKFYLFKSLFRNFGTLNIVNNLFEHLNQLVTDKSSQSKEDSAKLAAELISGLIRGSKYWNLNILKYLWSKIKPLLDLIMDNLTNETVSIWVDCFSYAFEDQDPRRMTFYINYFQDLMIDVFYELNKLKSADNKNQKSSSASSSSSLTRHACVVNLLTAFNQFEWRVPLLWANLTDSIIANMSHANKLVRELMPNVAIVAVTNEIDFNCCLLLNREANKFKPNSFVDLAENNKNYNNNLKHFDDDNLNKFITQIEIKLLKCLEVYELVHGDNCSAELKKERQRNNIDELLSSANFLNSLLNWLIVYLSRSLQPLNLEIIRLIPALCKIDKLVSDENFKSKLSTIRMFLPIWSLDLNCFDLIIEELIEIAKLPNWQSRIAALQLIKNFSIFNIFVLDNEAKDELKELVFKLLTDEQLEVREAAGEVLSALISADFIHVDQRLIDHFRESSNKTTAETTGKILPKRHAGVLGLCSIVSASPFELPDYLPDILTHLCTFVNDHISIQESVKKCLSEFKASHQDYWHDQKKYFTDAQLDVLSSSSYMIE